MPLTDTDPRAVTAGMREVLVWRRTFPGRPDQAAQVRRFAGFLLADLANCDEIIEVTGELTNNALVHSGSGLPGGRLTAEVRRWPGTCASVAIIDDGGPSDPSFRHDPADVDDLDALSEGGRGLPLVTALTSWWGWEGGPGGRTVTAFFLGR
ncbi:MAG: ATP-binding protein [Streptosporangiaceae bacterium]